MKLAYLVEVTALVSAHGKLLIEHPEEIATTALGDYYIHSRNRFNRWMRDLNDMEKGVLIRDPLHLFGLVPRFPAIQSITEQIIINDLLNRVWTVILVAADRHRHESRIEPLANNVFRSQITVRRKAMNVCMCDSNMSADAVQRVDKLRISAERWADLLNAPLMAEFDLWNYSFDEERARDFYADRFQQEHLGPSNSDAWALILAGLRHSFPDIDGLAAPLHDDDRMITRTIVDTFPGETRAVAAWSGTAFDRSRVM